MATKKSPDKLSASATRPSCVAWRHARTAGNPLRLIMTGLTLLILMPASALAQTSTTLPGETQLPGVVVEPAQLPSENVLPGTTPAESPATPLPGEEVLPEQDPVAVAAPESDQERVFPLGPSPPILRLDFEGHTGLVRTMDTSDGGRTLVSAGDDKDLHVWRRTDIGASGWMHRRTIRWPITRGPRGRIYVARTKQDLVAFAGHGAFGFAGEIRIVNAASGEQQQVLIDEQAGHRQVVLSLAWSPRQEPQLASIDLEGRVILWEANATTGLWGPRNLVPADSQNYGPEIAAALQSLQSRVFAPVTFLGEDIVVVPQYVGITNATNPPNLVNWHLRCIHLKDPGRAFTLAGMDHAIHVRSLSATDDGRVLASCEHGDASGGSVGIWIFSDAATVAAAKQIKLDSRPLFVDLDSEGKRLLVGTESGVQPARIQIWDITETPPRLLSERQLISDAIAGSLDSDHGEAIVAQGNEIEIYPYDAEGHLQDPQRLSVPAKPIRHVAFDKQQGNYRIAIGWRQDAEGKELLDAVFDLSESKLLGRAPIDPDDFLQPQRTASRWRYEYVDGIGDQLFEGEIARGVLPLLDERHGVPTAICTLPIPPGGAQDSGERAATDAVIVGTSGRSNIYAYRADAANPPELLRQFRDHSGTVISLTTSADGRYLVSGSADSTISVWNLQDVTTASRSVNRWGAEFEVEGGQLVATAVRADGPLYFRGVRDGDRLLLMEWINFEGESFAESDPLAMHQRLIDLPFDFMPRLKFTRLGQPGPDFQSFPAWRPLATLFIDGEREWAFWTPSGYYDASFNGHQRFGWQINGRYADRPVEYFRAAQFRKALERPDIMRHLLDAGSLTAAMSRTVAQIGPPPSENAIVNQIESRPTIRLITPSAGRPIEGDELIVEAEIEVPRGATLVPPKAFVSGVPAIRSEEILSARQAASTSTTYRWYFRLPRDPVLQLEILAATESEAVDRVLVDLEHVAGAAPRRRPRLHLIALGISQYRDPQIQSLDFAARAAGEIAALFQDSASEIYHTTTTQLVDDDATRPLWRVVAQSAAEELSTTAAPDDLVVMYLCGHGVHDRRTDQWYFVTADAKFRDMMNDQYADCIAFRDLALLSRLPCRKLAILDSCHSGAVQPVMRRDDLKSALRFLQDDVVLTLTASEGDEEASEQRESRLGRFTAALSDALRGAAVESDSDPDTVSLNEVIQYVSRRVADESYQEDVSQHPTASPAYLLRSMDLPLTGRPSPSP